MNKFTLGAIAGATSLMIAVPVLAQVSSAATETTGTTSSLSATTSANRFGRGPLTQAQVQTLADTDASFLTNVDALVTVLKTAVQNRKTALTAAAAITDETARQTAVKKAMTDFRTAMEAAITANPDLKLGMMHGGPGGPHGRGHGGKMGGKGPEMLAEKLGMTADELKAALSSGKTIEQIATEKGITLPARPAFGGRMHGMDAGAQENDANQQ